jgi:hypothetical protein
MNFKTKMTLLALLISLGGLSACDKGDADSESSANGGKSGGGSRAASKLDGTWVNTNQDLVEVGVTGYFIFSGNKLKVRTVCSSDTETVQVEVSKNVKITDGHIKVTGDTVSKKSEMENGFECTASLGAVEFDYVVSGDSLELTTQDGSFQFRRE